MESVWVASFGEPETAAVVGLLILLFFVGLAALWRRARSISHSIRVFTASMPSVLSTVGVLGTFYGIWLGLQDFDVTAIDASVPTLLEGLKTAFVTSLWGMALSVVYRLIANVSPLKASDAGSTLGALSTLIDEQRLARASSEQGLEALRLAVAGDGDSALTSQLCKLRNETRDGLDGLRTDAETHHAEHIQELRDFAKHMVENTNQALIEALEQVIRDFNQNLTEQFGENFKQLNAAVLSLVTWQENYRQHVDELQARIEAAVTALQSSSTALESVERSASAIPPSLDPLAPTLEAIQTSLDRVNQDLAAYASLHDKARNALPIVNDNLEAMTSGLKTSIDKMIERTDSALVNQRDAHGTLEAGYTTILSGAESSQTTFNDAVDAVMRRVSDELREATERMAKDLEASVGETDKQLKAQIEKVNKNLASELENALKLMADNLGSMSGKFVKDYEPLTRQLHELVNLARAANESSRYSKAD